MYTYQEYSNTSIYYSNCMSIHKSTPPYTEFNDQTSRVETFAAHFKQLNSQVLATALQQGRLQ